MPERKTKGQVVEEFRIQSIHEAAMRVIARKGLAQTTMQEIADEAGIAKGTIYLYFQDRTRLLESLADSTFARLTEQVAPIWQQPSSVAERILEIVRTQLLFFEENQEYFRVFHSFAADPDMRCRREQNPRWLAHIAHFEQLLSEGMRKREIRRQNPRRLAEFIADAFRALVFRRVLEPETAPPVEEDVELVVSTILRGILTERKSK